MSALENIRNSLIDRILSTKNEALLKAIENIFISTQEEEIVNHSSEQIELLAMSEDDIRKGKLISESELENMDDKWLQ